jgi:rare lipoprotein A
MGIKQVALSIVDKNTTRCGDTVIDPAVIDAPPPEAVAAKPARNSAPRRTREVPPSLRR